MAKRNGAARKRSGSRARSRRHRQSRGRGQRGLGEQLAPTEGQRMADDGWIEWGGELIWAVGFTSGGAPYGLRVCDFERAELEAMGLDVAALQDAGQLSTAKCSSEESNGRLRDDDAPF